jgi:hypothetical protein
VSKFGHFALRFCSPQKVNIRGGGSFSGYSSRMVIYLLVFKVVGLSLAVSSLAGVESQDFAGAPDVHLLSGTFSVPDLSFWPGRSRMFEYLILLRTFED